MTPMLTTIGQHPATTHVQNQLTALKFTDCLICGKTTEQIKKEAVDDYISRTVRVGETERETEARTQAFIAGMSTGTFVFVQAGVSQAAPCDGNVYTITTADQANVPAGALPIN